MPDHGAVRPLRVLVDALAFRLGGGATVLDSQLRALGERDDVAVTVVCSRDLAGALEAARVPVRVVRVPRLPLPARLIFEQLALPWLARRQDVLYMPATFAAWLARTPQVVLLQNAYHFGANARELRRSLLPWLLARRVGLESALARASVRRAERVVAVSQALAADVRQDCGDVQIEVILSATPALPLVERRDAGQDYVLCVANDYFHKDWDGLAKTFEEHPDLPRLVVVGAPRSARRLRLLRQRFARTEFVGPVRDRTRLADLYAGAACCVVHSRLESSSLTPLEALQMGVPAVVSDLPAHREVMQERATFYPAGNASELAAAVRRSLGAAGPPATALRTGAQHAEELVGVLRQAAGGPEITV